VKLSLSRALDVLLYVAVAALGLLFLSRKMSGPPEGKLAAPFDLPIADRPGSRFLLEEQRGKPVLVEVFASWCGACRRAAPTMRDAFTKHRAAGVTFVGVSLDSDLETASRVKREWDIPYDVALDDAGMAKSYGIEVLPTFVVIDRDGIVRHVSTGAPSRSEVDRWLSEL